MVTLFFLTLIVTSSFAADDVSRIAEIENRVLANRREITRAHMVVESNCTYLEDGKPSFVEIGRTFFLDGEKVRCDKRRRYDQMPSFIDYGRNHKTAYFTEKYCFSEDEFFLYSDVVMANEKNVVVTVTTRERAWKNVAYRTPDLRMWGMTAETFGNSGASHMESLIAAPRRERLTLSRAVERQVECQKIAFFLDEAHVQVWVAPTMGYSVLRIQREFDSGKDTHYVDNIEMDVKKQEPSGIWFPVASHFRRTENGKLTWEEHAKATIYSLNEPLDPKLFTLAALDIPAGRRVSKYGADPRQYWVWDGEKVVAMTANGTIAEGQGAGGRIFFILLSTGFAILASILIWRWSRAKQTKELHSN